MAGNLKMGSNIFKNQLIQQAFQTWGSLSIILPRSASPFPQAIGSVIAGELFQKIMLPISSLLSPAEKKYYWFPDMERLGAARPR